jgi:choline dehydrogenase-like flavoprotein
MSTSPDGGVIDNWGRVWDVDNLYLADGSIVPTSLGVNPQVTIMAMATRIAWRMRDSRPN